MSQTSVTLLLEFVTSHSLTILLLRYLLTCVKIFQTHFRDTVHYKNVYGLIFFFLVISLCNYASVY